MYRVLEISDYSKVYSEVFETLDEAQTELHRQMAIYESTYGLRATNEFSNNENGTRFFINADDKLFDREFRIVKGLNG